MFYGIIVKITTYFNIKMELMGKKCKNFTNYTYENMYQFMLAITTDTTRNRFLHQFCIC